MLLRLFETGHLGQSQVLYNQRTKCLKRSVGERGFELPHGPEPFILSQRLMSQTALSRILCDFVQDIEGHIYGTTAYGGSFTVCGFSGCGTIFKITSKGTLSTEYIFCPQAPCTNGNYPASRLLLAIDGNPFGTTHEGGAVNWGSVYKFNRRAR
jgi:hypothetical protein